MFFKNFEKTQPNSLYWFAAEQQTSASRLQNVDFPYVELSHGFKELSLPF